MRSLAALLLTATCCMTAQAAPPALLDTWGSCTSTSPPSFHPTGVAVAPDGSVYVTDEPAGRVLHLSNNGSLLAILGAPGSGPGEFANPQGIAIATNGEVYVADTFNNRVQRFDASGAPLGAWGTLGTGDGHFNAPRGIVVLPDRHVVVGDTQGRLQEFTADGSFVRSWPLDPFDLSGHAIYGIARASSGDLFITTQPFATVYHHSAAGGLLSQWSLLDPGPAHIAQPFGVACTPGGDVLVGDIDLSGSRICQFTAAGAFVQSWGGTGSAPGQFSRVSGLAVGAGDVVYAGDAGNCRLQVFGPSAVPTKRDTWGALKRRYR